MTRREVKADFEAEINLELRGLGIEARPDAINVRDFALAPGPIAHQDASQGLLNRVWYVRTDAEEQDVYLARSNEFGTEWEDEALLFGFTGADIDDMALAFDPNGRAVVFTIRAGNLWVYFFDASVGDFAFNNVGAGQGVRCILDDPTRPREADVVAFYIATAGLRYRILSERFTIQHDAGQSLTSNHYVERLILGTDRRVHVLLSVRDPNTGTWSFGPRLSSKQYPYDLGEESADVSSSVLGGDITLVVRSLVGLPDDVDVASLVLGGVITVPLTTTAVLEEFEVFPDLYNAELVQIVIPYASEPDEMDVSTLLLAGDLEDVVIVYDNAAPEEVDVATTILGGTLVVP